MMTMLEKMATAIGSHLYGYVSADDTPNTWATSVSAARAALEAIREVDESLFAEHPRLRCGDWYTDGCAPVFIAMIDSILNERTHD
jgi:hypothetical protein